MACHAFRQITSGSFRTSLEVNRKSKGALPLLYCPLPGLPPLHGRHVLNSGGMEAPVMKRGKQSRARKIFSEA